MADRIRKVIAETKAIVEARDLTPEQIEKMSRQMDITLEEYAAFQEAKALAQAAGRITYDEALTIYAALGRTPTAFNSRPLHVKAAIIRAIGEIVGVAEVGAAS